MTNQELASSLRLVNALNEFRSVGTIYSPMIQPSEDGMMRLQWFLDDLQKLNVQPPLQSFLDLVEDGTKAQLHLYNTAVLSSSVFLQNLEKVSFVDDCDYNETSSTDKLEVTREARTILQKWLDNHLDYPYPNEQEKVELCKSARLTLTQVSNWFINARRRQFPPERKPHKRKKYQQLSPRST